MGRFINIFHFFHRQSFRIISASFLRLADFLFNKNKFGY